MGIDRTNNDYHEIEGLTNVLWEQHKSTPAQNTYVLDRHIGPGIRRIAMARPEWTLIGQRAAGYGSTGPREVTRFDVWDGTEKMGVIEREYRNSDYCYAVTNTRIAKGLHRGQYRYTKDTAKALKIIYETFSPKSHSEAINEARQHVTSKLNSLANGKKYDWDRARDQYAPAVINAFLIEHWGEIMEALETVLPAKTLAKCAEAPDNYREWREREKLQSAYAEGRGLLIMIRGGKYVAFRNQHGDKAATLVEAPMLADSLKTGMGLLKLSPDETIIPGIGYRHNASTFFLMDPEKETPDA